MSAENGGTPMKLVRYQHLLVSFVLAFRSLRGFHLFS
jgi:hypothetical protein